MRHDFNAATKRILASRVAHRCSRCEAPTIGPHEDPAKSVSIGVAAHITAASPAGPRFDASIVESERMSPVNGIWLCQSCATIVDRDELRYTVATLRDMKRAAEDAAWLRVGVPTWRVDVSMGLLAPAFQQAPAGRSQELQMTWHHVDALLTNLRAVRSLLVELETYLDESDIDPDARRRIGVVNNELVQLWRALLGQRGDVLRPRTSTDEYEWLESRTRTSTWFDPVDQHWNLIGDVGKAFNQVERWLAELAIIRTAERGLQDVVSHSHSFAADAREVVASLIRGAGVSLKLRSQFPWADPRMSPDFSIPVLNAYLDVVICPPTVPFVMLRNDLRARIKYYSHAQARSSGRAHTLRRTSDSADGADGGIRLYFIIYSASPLAPVFEVKFKETRVNRRVREVCAFFVTG